MNYISTRGLMAKTDGSPYQFCDILLEGLMPDGGLSMPQRYPQVANELEHFSKLSYADLAFEVISRFATDIPVADLRSIVSSSYTARAFGSDTIVPLQPLGDSKLQLLKVSEGPTLAFKDIAMQLLGNLFEYVLAKQGRELNILGATSGDTGSAAEWAMKGKRGIRVFMLSPQGRMSAFQRAQMYGLSDPNIFNIAVDGVFDDCQDIVKAVGEDASFKAKHAIGTVNSINWARVCAQIVYYFWGYFRAIEANGKAIGEPVSFCVPSGNFGNILAGHVARMMGLPVGRLVLATNENNVLDEFFRTGVYRPRGSANTYATSSPSMDISKASNFERFVFDLVGRDASNTASKFRGLGASGSFSLSSSEMQALAPYQFVSGASNHANRVAVIRAVFERWGVVIDPHTADGVAVAQRLLSAGEIMLCLETALPAKFEDTIREALGVATPKLTVPAGYEAILNAPLKYVSLPNDLAAVKELISSNT
jgi:threonine synthase